MRVTIYFFHPFPRRSTTNQSLFRAVESIPGVRVRDMYATYPDFAIDVDAEQALLLETDVVVLQHPFYWYSCPALMKEWLDSVLEKGWAYGPGGDKLEGKHWIQAITTGGGAEAYHRDGGNEFTMTEFLRPFERTARLCGMKIHAPLIAHGAPRLTDDLRRDFAQSYRTLIENALRGRLPPEYSSHSWKTQDEFPRLP